MTADLRANQILCQCEIDAPKQGRPRTRLNWLVRQLEKAPDTLRVEAFALHARGPSAAELLKAVRPNPEVLITDPTRELKSFRLTQITPLGAKRGTGRGSFIDSVVDAVDAFYVDILQQLKTWSAPPPKLREEPETPGVPNALVSTALSSQDEPDVAITSTDDDKNNRAASSAVAALDEPLSERAVDDDSAPASLCQPLVRHLSGTDY